MASTSRRKPTDLLAAATLAAGIAVAVAGQAGRDRLSAPRPVPPDRPVSDRARARRGRAGLSASGEAFDANTDDDAYNNGRDRDGAEAAQGGGHAAGRDARVPEEIPARGWLAVLKRVGARFGEDRIMAEAAGITYYVLLALFPAIGALVSLYGFFADPATISDHLSTLSGFVPAGGMNIIGDQVHAIAAKGRSTLGFGVAVGLLVSLWSANQGIKSLFDALNIVYGEHEKRGFFKLTALTLAFTLGTLVMMILAMAAIVVVPVILTYVGLDSDSDMLLNLMRWPALLVVIVLFLAALYRFGPSRQRARWRWVTWGSVAAALVWVGASAGFSWYVANFGSYDKTYGSLGAAIGFMTWIWISSIIVLVGGELNAELEHQTARDTTDSGRPLGERGALKADTVAA